MSEQRASSLEPATLTQDRGILALLPCPVLLHPPRLCPLPREEHSHIYPKQAVGVQTRFWLGDHAQTPLPTPLCLNFLTLNNRLISEVTSQGCFVCGPSHNKCHAMQVLAIHVINAAGSHSILLRKWHGPLQERAECWDRAVNKTD